MPLTGRASLGRDDPAYRSAIDAARLVTPLLCFAAGPVLVDREHPLGIECQCDEQLPRQPPEPLRPGGVQGTAAKSAVLPIVFCAVVKRPARDRQIVLRKKVHVHTGAISRSER